MYSNVRYAYGIVNRTETRNMDPIEVMPETAAAVKKKPAKRKSKAKKKAPKRPAKTKPKKAGKRAAKRKAPKRKAVKAKKTQKRKANGDVVRTERLDMRLSKAEKAKISAKAKKTGRTITKVVIAAIASLR